MDTDRKQGKLYLCATPIGNLEDITLRVLRTLREVDLIAAEDTRNSIHLLNHFEIRTPLTSYHEYNKIDKAYELIDAMRRGKNIALITDAGSPGISDPGEELVRICYEEGIEVTALPGASACVTALTLSGLPARRFSFEAFLPREKKERAAVLKELASDTRTLVIYEAPHHLVQTLKDLLEMLGERDIAVCRELTKVHETVWRTSFSEAISRYEAEGVRGECVIVIEGRDPGKAEEESQARWREMPLNEHMEQYLQQGMSRKDAMKAVAKDRGISKREVYSLLLEEKGNSEG